jgi:hypothetical protein
MQIKSGRNRQKKNCLMVHTNTTNFTTNSFTSFQTRILAQKNRQRTRPF